MDIAHHFSVELFFDSEAEERIRAIWKRLKEAHISAVMANSGARPHTSLTVFDGNVPEKLGAKLPQFTEYLSSFELSFAAFGAFPNESGVFYLAPRPSDALLQTYRTWYSCCTESNGAIWEKYRPADWTPHCTLSVSMPFRLGRADVSSIALAKEEACVGGLGASGS